MSRASQAGLEVERYIGSCLISSTLRPTLQKTIVNNNNNNNIITNNNINTNNTNSNNNNNSIICTNNNNCTSKKESFGTWTGAPLISMTSSPRRNNQRSSPSPCQQQQHSPIEPQSQPQAQSQQHQTHQQVSSHLQNRSPLSRLAIHTQGAPLILAGRFHNRGKPVNSNNVIAAPNVNNFCNVNINSNGNTMSVGRCPPVRSLKNIVEVPRKLQSQHQYVSGYQHQQQQQQIQQQQMQQQQIHQQQSQQQTINLKNDCHGKLDNSSGASIANIDSLSIASDESSNNCENSLPRIIKPRKRRKKDRKPTNVVTTENSKPEDRDRDRDLSVSMNPGLMPSGMNGDQSNLVTLKPYVPVCYEAMRYELPQQQQQGTVQHRAHRRPPVTRESYSGRTQTLIQQEIVDTRQSSRYAHRHAQVKVLDDNRNVVVPVLVRTSTTALAKGYRNHNHHPPANNNNNNTTNNSCNNNNSNSNNCNNNNTNNSNSNNCNNRLVHGNPGNRHRYINGYDSCEKSGLVDDPGSCQCRYCNPSGLIWDVDQNGYSPFLTPPPTSNGSNNEFVQFSQIPLFLSRANLGGGFPVGAARVGHERLEPPGGALLRRSWSDPSSYFSEQICAPSRDVGVIGDRGQTAEALARGRSSWPGSPSYVSLGTNASGLSGSLPGNSVTGQSLEVSTEIVTSHNGHRDLEIKFFSSSPSSIQPEEEKSPFPEDNEDFSDIWSYHESKLQQDFRTLLQAEE
ncbi:GSCOCG00000454001-RA-CDS [Cotesia congregata]|nr:GSCOCG00000454001-RA-CDS [Cotesia congregata]